MPPEQAEDAPPELELRKSATCFFLIIIRTNLPFKLYNSVNERLDKLVKVKCCALGK